MYDTLILIDQETSITGESLANAIQEVFSSTRANSPKITASGSSIKLAWTNFELELYHSKEGHVLEESADISVSYAEGKVQAEAIARCSQRIEISGDDDPGMDYFNDYCCVVGAIEKLGEVYTFDLGSSSFMNL